MTDEQIECLVERIIRHFQSPILVVVTAATGYRHEIRNRLAGCGQRLHILLEEGVDDADLWQALGETFPASEWLNGQLQTPYQAVLLPFLDYPLAASLVSGASHSPIARYLHNTLLTGVPVLALRYHCDPGSELNELMGSNMHSDYARHIQRTLARLAECGITLCTMNEMLERLLSETTTAAPARGVRRYLTVKDIVNNPTLVSAHEARLTDAALDFLKSRKK